jgi:hypothetical protein
VQKTFDIIKDNEFIEANMCFKTAITELKANAKGTTEHHPIVSEEDRKNIYSSIHTSPTTPLSLTL